DRNVVRANSVLNDFHGLGSDDLCPFQARPDGRSQANLKLPAFDPGEDFGPNPWEQDDNSQAGRDDISANQHPSKTQCGFEAVAIKASQPLEPSTLFAMSCS